MLIVLGPIVIGLIVFSIFSRRDDCKSRIEYNFQAINKDLPLDRLYRPITHLEVNTQLQEWRTFEASPDTLLCLGSIYLHGRQGTLIQTLSENEGHYAAVISPERISNEKKHPVLIWANGLNQRSPTVSTSHRKEIRELLQQLPDYYIIIPSFRGQSLEIGGKTYCSDGFFGDAFDGATDDVLTSLSGTLSKFKHINASRIAIYGVSRGGTVALLAGIRNPQIKSVIAQSGPTNFLGKQYLERYSFQYKYQFLSWTDDVEEMRKKIIKSSPVHFIQSYQGNLMVVHGRNDPVVPIAHANQIIEKLTERSVEVLITNSGHENYEIQAVVDWLVRSN